MLKRTIHKTWLFVVQICMILITVSCIDDELVDKRDNGRITFSVTDVKNSTTSSESKSDTTTMPQALKKRQQVEIGNRELTLSFDIEENNDYSQSAQKPATRGAAFDNGSHRITKMYATAISHTGDGGNTYFKDVEVNISDSRGATDYYWPSGKLSFFAHACSKETVTIDPQFERIGGVCQGSFDYTLPSASTGKDKKDATNQPDIIFAITPDCEYNANPNVSLVFHHALSAIVFKVGRMPEGVFIKSIAINGVYSSGSCAMTAKENNNISYVWSYNGLSQNGIYTEDIKADAVTGAQMGDEESVFMMLPQTMGNNTRFDFVFSINGTEYTLSKEFNTFITQWEPDKKYIFTIGLPDEIDVEIEDQVDGVVKKNVKIQNTGITVGYIRAAIVGYWINPGGLVGEMLEEEDGTYVWGSEWNQHWKRGSDGFYYHLQPVEHYDYTYPLFETYTLNEEHKDSHDKQILEMNIAVQIIPTTEKDLWPELNQ